MPTKVSDIRANLNENIIHAVKIIGKRALHRRQVFEAIYKGKKKIKTVKEISDMTGLSRMRVLQEAGKLQANQIVDQVKIGKETAYKKDDTYTHHKNKILTVLDNPKKESNYPTKQSPKITTNNIIKIKIPGKKPTIKFLTAYDIDSFKEVRNINSIDTTIKLKDIAESTIKKGLQNIIGDSNENKDWGGEKNDLYTNKLEYKRRKRLAAFALKGKATSGDQISRLMGSAAEIFFVVYHGKIDESIIAQLEAFALGKAMNGKSIYYGVIDGNDLNRLYQAYRQHFE